MEIEDLIKDDLKYMLCICVKDNVNIQYRRIQPELNL